MPQDNQNGYRVPSLASHLDIVDYPFLVSACIPGVRAYIQKGEIKGLFNNIIVNKQLIQYVKETFEFQEEELEVVISLDKELDYKKVMDYVKTEDAISTFFIQVHDIKTNKPYNTRLADIINLVSSLNKENVAFVPQRLIYGLIQLKQFEQACSLAKYDGVIIRKYTGDHGLGIWFKKLTML